MSFRTSLSGLDAASTDLSVIGNNIANASTNGFKESRAEFVDVFATTFSGVSSSAPGSGVRVSSVSQQFSQGNVEFTSSSLDLAINGEGFFILSDDGSQAYTRAGSYSTDRDGFVVDSSGRQLQIFPANSNGSFNTGALASLQLSTSDSSPNATTTITPVLNLDATQTTPTSGTFSPTDANSFNHSTSTTVYDSLGNPFPATMYYVASDPAQNEWQVHTYVDGSPLTLSGGSDAFFTMTFAGDGSFANTQLGAASAVTSSAALGAFTVNATTDTDATNDFSLTFNNSADGGSDNLVINATTGMANDGSDVISSLVAGFVGAGFTDTGGTGTVSGYGLDLGGAVSITAAITAGSLTVQRADGIEFSTTEAATGFSNNPAFGNTATTTNGTQAVTGVASTSGQISFDNLALANGSSALSLSFNYSDTTQFGGDFAVNSLGQDGFASGRLSGIDIDQTGVVFARFTNGQSDVLGQVALASFPNTQGLRQLGNTSWAETFSAGDRVIGSAGTAGFGSLQSGALEASNVDIATQLVSLITAQRNFQANAQAITTQNEIQQAIINIR